MPRYVQPGEFERRAAQSPTPKFATGVAYQTLGPATLTVPPMSAEGPPSLSAAQWAADLYNPLRTIAAYAAIAFVFIQFTKLHEILSFSLHIRTFLVDLIGIPATLLMLFCGGLQRTLRWRPAKYWLGFILWMLLAVPFSSWKGGSTIVFIAFVRTQVVLLFMIAGCVATWKELRLLIKVITFSAAFNVIAGIYIGKAQHESRLDLGEMTLGNSNDFAALLQMILPFLLIVVFNPKKAFLMRMMCLMFVVLGQYLSLTTGSRGGLVAMICTGLYLFLRSKASQKLALLVVLPLVGMTLVAVLPGDIVRRLATMGRNDEGDPSTTNEGAASSTEGRKYLLQKSLIVTLQHPLFGVGTGEFKNFEGTNARKQGQQGSWHETHNAYTQVSSEVGIPAAIFFIAAIVSTYRYFNRIYNKARQQPHLKDSREIATITLCLMMSLVGFCTSAFFLSLAYTFFLPALSGIAIVFLRLQEQEWNMKLTPGPQR
jgi:O-antigen ligase